MLRIIFKVLVFIFATTILAEYLVNRVSSTAKSALFIVAEAALLLLLFYKPIKTLFK